MTKKVIVTNISSTASEKTVKDFFLFCGKIIEFELIKDENCDKQTAYITFDKESGAKTAIMLTKAVLGDSQIVVKSADDTSSDYDSDDNCPPHTKERTKADIVAEILAAGYQLQDTITETGRELDAKLGLSTYLSHYISSLQSTLQGLDDRYKFVEKVTAKASEYAIQDKVKLYASQAQDRAAQALETSPGKIAHDLYTTTYKQIGHIQCQARRIAEEKSKSKCINGNDNLNDGIQAH